MSSSQPAQARARPARPLVEVVQRLEQIAQLHPDTRLSVDMARDAVSEASRELGLLASKVRRGRRLRRRQRGHIRQLVEAVLSVPVPPWPLPHPAPTPEDAAEAFRLLRHEGLPALASELHAAA